eukprot:2559866-Lingulodinium_polyedra.AAC.1
MPGILHVTAYAACSVIRTDYCQFGTAWQKPTRLLGIHIGLSALARTCQWGKGNCCSRTGKRHVQLCGKCPHSH